MYSVYAVYTTRETRWEGTTAAAPDHSLWFTAVWIMSILGLENGASTLPPSQHCAHAPSAPFLLPHAYAGSAGESAPMGSAHCHMTPELLSFHHAPVVRKETDWLQFALDTFSLYLQTDHIQLNLTFFTIVRLRGGEHYFYRKVISSCPIGLRYTHHTQTERHKNLLH